MVTVPDMAEHDALAERVAALEALHASDPAEPPDEVATWTGVVEGPTQPEVTIAASVYPDEAGVQFLVNGEPAESPQRPAGYDSTGPADGSTFHVYPDVDLTGGDTVTARWTDGALQSHTASATVVDTGGGGLDAPVLTLTGGDTTIAVGDVWNEPGFSATDLQDGDLTDQVVVTGSVDPATAGIYTITYEVTDSDGQTASTTRTVTVEEPAAPVDPGDGTPYVTRQGESVVIPAGFPTPATTGLSDPDAVAAGPVLSGKVVASAGQVIENLTVRDGYIQIQGNDVTIRNVKIEGQSGSHFGIDCQHDFTGVLIEDVEMDLVGFTKPIGVYGRGFTVRRSLLRGTRTGVQLVGAALIEDCFIESSWYDDVSHGTAASVHGHGGCTFRHNAMMFTAPRGGSSALSLYGNVAPLDDILVDGNWFLAHAAYLLKGGWSDAKPYGTEITNIRVVGNVFSRQFYPDGGRSGPVSNWNNEAEGAVWTGNVWEDTGLLV